MGRILDLPAAVKRTGVRGDPRLAVENAHRLQAGMDGQDSAHAGVRDRVVVQIEAHIGRLADRYDANFIGRKRVVRQREQTLALLGEGVTDRQ